MDVSFVGYGLGTVCVTSCSLMKLADCKVVLSDVSLLNLVKEPFASRLLVF
jgi:hypothetical protein